MLLSNKKEPCNITIYVDNATWNLTERWIQPGSRKVAWWDGHKHSEGCTFHRIFSPEELEEKGITLADIEQMEREQNTPSPYSILSKPIQTLHLPVRARMVLLKMGLKTIDDVTHCSKRDLLMQKNFGETSLREVQRKLEDYGLYLRDDE